jgi:hypothetical protein
MGSLKIDAAPYFIEGRKLISVCTFHIYGLICFENQYTSSA